MPRHVLSAIDKLISGITNPTITILGIAYKADVDDTRETPALKIIKLAENAGYKVKAHDPWVQKFEYPLYSLEESCMDSDCLVLITDHSIFSHIDPQMLSSKMRHRNLFDTRNFLDHKSWQKAGFKVNVIGNVSTKDN